MPTVAETDVAEPATAAEVLDDALESLRERKKHATRKAIEDAAWALFAERGYDATSVHDIAARADVAPRTFFRYFPSKDAVLYGDLDEALVVFREEFRARPADEPLLTSMIAATDVLSDRFQEDQTRTLARVQIQQAASLAAFTDYASTRFLAVARELVLEREGERPDADLRARLVAGLFGTVHLVANELWMENDCEGAMHDIGTRCFNVLHELLAEHEPSAD